jgi:ATP-binding cassette subfamily C protein LapB
MNIIMPSKSLISLLLDIQKIKFSSEKLDDALIAADNMEDMSSIDRLSNVIDKMSDGALVFINSSVGSISQAELPCLVFTNKNWFVLSQNKESLQITNDGEEFRIISDFTELVPGIALWVKERRSQKHEYSEQTKTAFSFILSSALRDKKWLFDIVAATIFVNVFSVVAGLYAMQVYDRVVPTLALQTLATLTFGLVIIYIFDFFLKRLRSKILDSVAADVDDEISDKIYNHLLNIRLDALPQQLGTLTAKVSGIESARQFFSSSIVFVLVDFPFAFLFLGAIAIVGGWVSFVYLFFLVLSLVIGFLYQSKSRKLVETVQWRSNERLGVLVDTIKGIETIKSSGLIQDRRRAWRDLSTAISDPSLAQKKLSSNASTISSFFSQLAYAAAVVLGVMQVGNGNMTMGSMIAVSILGGRVLGPCGQVVSLLLQYETTKQSLSMVDELLALPIDLDEKKAIFPNYRPQRIELEDVKYQHADTAAPQLVIDNLTITAGERIAILGPIGSGKSTLLKIISGLYHPTEGFVKINGVDLWSVDRGYLNNHVAYLSQTPLLFKGDLRSNLMMDRSVSEVRFNDVFQSFGLERIVQKSDKGLDLPIHEGGVGLSGGQRQMISLARIFLGKSAVWIFDEPTASLDPSSQQLVLNAVNNLIPSEDIVVIATHNPKFATDFSNRLIVMGAGKIDKDVPTNKVELKRRVS